MIYKILTRVWWNVYKVRSDKCHSMFTACFLIISSRWRQWIRWRLSRQWWLLTGWSSSLRSDLWWGRLYLLVWPCSLQEGPSSKVLKTKSTGFFSCICRSWPLVHVYQFICTNYIYLVWRQHFGSKYFN